MMTRRGALGRAAAATALMGGQTFAGGAFAGQPRPAGDLSGLSAFDFLEGDWITQHRRLKSRLAGSTEWIEFGGTFTHRRLMDGFGNSGDNLFDMPGGAYRGVSFRSYDASTGEWSVWWLDGRNPSAPLGAPTKGRFTDGGGLFLSEDTFQGRPIKVRVVWTRPTPDTATWEQAFSADGGRTWEVNWITHFRRPSAPFAPFAPGGSGRDGLHAFDLRPGRWNVRHRRLADRLAGSTEWVEFGGEQTWWPTLGGAGNVDTNLFRMPGGAYSGATLRSYDAKTDEWLIWWLDGRNPTGPLDPALRGRFKDGTGLFYADETFRGKPIRVRFIWSGITPTRAHWEQAFSPDGGQTWETNWTTEFEKAAST